MPFGSRRRPAAVRAIVAGAPEPGRDRRRDLVEFQRRLGVRFRHGELLNLALAHRSFANEQNAPVRNNERLEFLGDSVLGLVVADHLYRRFPDRSEGDLAKVKSVVVSEESLAEVAQRLDVDRYLLLGKGEENSGGRGKRAILADAMEAIIGAYYLDAGFRATYTFVLDHLRVDVDRVLSNKHRKDYKTLLQEYAQRLYHEYPKYKMVKRSGPDHAQTFWVEVTVSGESFGPAKGRSKKVAEQNAAEIAYVALSEAESGDEAEGCEDAIDE